MQTEVIAALIAAAAGIVTTLITVRLGQRAPAENPGLSSSREARRKTKHRYEVFVSSPLAAVNSDKALGAMQEEVGKVVALLEGQFGFSVYWAGRNIKKKADFEAADISARKDVAALVDSKYFLMIYPEKLASSVLFEAGIALRECITSIYFVSKRSNLPFLMAEASQAFDNVRTYEGSISGDLTALLTRHGKSFFDPQRGE